MDGSPMSELFSIAGKTALVTGGSRGIGRMIAEGYVMAGARVYISSRKADACDATAEELKQHGTCFSVPANLSTEEGCSQLVDVIAGREEKVEVLHIETTELFIYLDPHGCTLGDY